MQIQWMWWSGFILILLISSIMTKNEKADPRQSSTFGFVPVSEFPNATVLFATGEWVTPAQRLAWAAACTAGIGMLSMALPMIMNAMNPPTPVPPVPIPLPLPPTETLGDVPSYGKRELEEGFSEPETCLFDCGFRRRRQEPLEGNIRVIIGCDSEVFIKVIHRPISVPIDYTCMNDCYDNPINTGFDPVKQSCEMNRQNSLFACHVYAQAKYDEDDVDLDNDVKERFYVAQGRISEVISYCIEEQLDRGINMLNNEQPGATVSDACSKLIGATLEGERVKRSLNFQQSRNLTISQRDSRYGKEQKREKRQITADVNPQFEYATTPWLCSLKFTGFRGRHRCGVVLLSAYPEKTVLVSAAHCNTICKDMATNDILEMCCCIDPNINPYNSCARPGQTAYCGSNAQLVMAEPKDFQIVCGEYTTEIAPQDKTPEDEAVLNILAITQHPNYEIGEPLRGYDIAVYHVQNPEALKEGLDNDKINPAAMPIDPTWYDDEFPGRLYAWRDPEPPFRSRHRGVNDYISSNFLPRPSPMIPMDYCKDPDWMQSNTYYPRGTVCYTDKSEKGCVTFGNSGSPLVRLRTDQYTGERRYHWVGTLSMSKGCDQTEVFYTYKQIYGIDVPVFDTKAENAAVFTDGLCYLDWISQQYNMKLPYGYEKPWHCYQGEVGDWNDYDKDECMSSSGFPCDFTTPGNPPQCDPYSFEGFSYNVFLCTDIMGNAANCANNCKGVDPNSIGVGGTAIRSASALGGTEFLAPSGQLPNYCPPGQCRNTGSNSTQTSRRRCCRRRRGRRGRSFCPSAGC